jgi:hypothetical protein
VLLFFFCSKFGVTITTTTTIISGSVRESSIPISIPIVDTILKPQTSKVFDTTTIDDG